MSLPLLLAADAPAAGSGWFVDHLSLGIGILVVVVGLFVIGLADLKRFSGRRISAIAGVCFDESIRRKVLWIIPLAILGLVAVDLLQRPSDAQDAIRQTTKFCLMTTGLVVVTSTVILACTNLPREIENRVIFTVVTKPTTRLEIVLGKIAGFAMVSATILLIMGLFSFGYLHARAWYLERNLRSQLAAGTVDPISRPTFQHYAAAGLLNAKSLVEPVSMAVFEREPDRSSPRRYPSMDGYVLVPFHMPDDSVASMDAEGKTFKGPGMTIRLKLGYDLSATLPPLPGPVTTRPTTQPAAPRKPVTPRVTVSLFTPNGESLAGPQEVGDPNGLDIPSADGSQDLLIDVPTPTAARAAVAKTFYVAVAFSGGDGNEWVLDDPAAAASLLVPVVSADQKSLRTVTVAPSNLSDPTVPVELTYTGREGTFGQVIKGLTDAGTGQTCVLRFRGADVRPAGGPDAAVPVEMRAGIEKAADAVSEDTLTDVTVRVLNLDTKVVSPPVVVQPENNRTLFASIPASAVRGGNFDVILQCKSNDQWVGFRQNSLAVVRSESSFALNLFKSLAVLWLLAVFVTTISIFASTFLSWPIAVVLTVLVLFGRWGVDTLGDATAAGVGRSIVTEFRIESAPVGEVVSTGVESLNKLLKGTAYFLPDVSRFSATDDIERGVAMPWQTLLAATTVLLAFGLPLATLAYVFLKNKEVAP